EVLAPRHLPRGEVDGGELRVVVEHLLEVRDLPGRVGRVAMETAADVIVDAARRHLLERQGHHLEGPRLSRATVVAEQEVEVRGARELRPAPEAAVHGVEASGEPVERVAERGRVGQRLRGGARADRTDLRRDLARLRDDAERVRIEIPADLLERVE